MTASATTAQATTHAARTVTSVPESEAKTFMTDPSVPFPPPSVSPHSATMDATNMDSADMNSKNMDSKKVRQLRVALPLLTLSWLILLVIVVASLVRIERWELAPGEALEVGPRIQFVAGDEEPPTRYDATNGIHFVTAYGGKLSALDAFVGWIDPDVQVDTYKERFGDQTPSSRRVMNQQAMISSKKIAEYVALKRLGFDVELIMGPAIVGDVICEDDPHPKSACKVLNVGDTITEFNGSVVNVLTDLFELSAPLSPGDEVTITVRPHQSPEGIEKIVRVIANPSDPTRTIIGFIPVDTRTVQLPFDVGISTADIGGPSAGLAFTLAILDELTPGNLMGRGKVVATGTMNDKEEVGAVGAIRQKAVAARAAGAQLFLIPSSQSPQVIEEARQVAGSKMTVVTVATLDDALNALQANGGDRLPSTSRPT
jgi:PDZ domain-containing protein